MLLQFIRKSFKRGGKIIVRQLVKAQGIFVCDGILHPGRFNCLVDTLFNCVFIHPVVVF